MNSHFKFTVCSNDRPVDGWLSTNDVTRPVARSASWDRLRASLSSASIIDAAAVHGLRAASRHWTRVRIGRLSALWRQRLPAAAQRKLRHLRRVDVTS